MKTTQQIKEETNKRFIERINAYGWEGSTVEALKENTKYEEQDSQLFNTLPNRRGTLTIQLDENENIIEILNLGSNKKEVRVHAADIQKEISDEEARASQPWSAFKLEPIEIVRYRINKTVKPVVAFDQDGNAVALIKDIDELTTLVRKYKPQIMGEGRTLWYAVERSIERLKLEEKGLPFPSKSLAKCSRTPYGLRFRYLSDLQGQGDK